MFFKHFINKPKIPYSGSKRIPDKFEHNLIVIKPDGRIGSKSSLLRQMFNFGGMPKQILLMNKKDFDDIVKVDEENIEE